jgi:2-aminoadipate transaminase
MCELLDDLLPELGHTTPEGGLFLIASLPPALSSRKVFSEGIEKKVAVLPGLPFYVDGGGDDIIRMNFSSASEEQIHEGVRRLAQVIRSLGKG